MRIVTIITMIGLFGSYTAPYINPNVFYFSSLLGYTYHYLLIVNIILLDCTLEKDSYSIHTDYRSRVPVNYHLLWIEPANCTRCPPRPFHHDLQYPDARDR